MDTIERIQRILAALAMYGGGGVDGATLRDVRMLCVDVLEMCKGFAALSVEQNRLILEAAANLGIDLGDIAAHNNHLEAILGAMQNWRDQ